MDKTNLLYCATDSEIYDVLMSSKQRITDAILLELAKDRGIFYSSKDSRETLAQSLSLLPHDYHDLGIILQQREHSGRGEKLTSITLNAALTIDDIKAITKEYQEQSPSDEKVLAHQKGTDQYVVTVHYTDVDHSKTRLVQRKPKEAGIEFYVENDKTVIRMPSNTKAKEIATALKNRLDSRTKTNIPTSLIELTEFTSAKDRTQFFTTLISTLPGFKLDNVTSVKVEPITAEESESELDLDDDQDKEQAKQEMLALVKKVALNGQSLLLSDEYQGLQAKGFFITSIIWRAKQTTDPFPIVEFEAAFEEPELGKGFKYSVRGMLNFQEGEYTKTLRPISTSDKQEMLKLIEQTASNAIVEIRKQGKTDSTDSIAEDEDI